MRRPGSQKLIWLFLNYNLCCLYSEEMSQLDGSFEHSNTCLNLWVRFKENMGKN